MQSGLLFFFPFDPMGMASPEMQVKEVKNARLAMVWGLSICSGGGHTRAHTPRSWRSWVSARRLQCAALAPSTA